MLALRIMGLGMIGLAAAAAVAVCPAPAEAAAGKEPPACGQVSFRPLVPGAPDGEQDAGLYKSRFVKIELKATVQGGVATDYHLLINGKPAQPMAGGIPKSAEACLKSKHVVVPVKAISGACLGNRFRVVLDRSSGKKLALLFGLQGNDWYYCNGSVLP